MRISDWSSDVCSSDLIDQVTFAHTSYAPPPARFEAGTPHIIGAIGLHAAIDYVEGIGMDLMIEHETALVRLARERSEEHTSELQSLMRISYAVFCLKQKKKNDTENHHTKLNVLQ